MHCSHELLEITVIAAKKYVCGGDVADAKVQYFE
jgi:hypothetical protein